MTQHEFNRLLLELVVKLADQRSPHTLMQTMPEIYEGAEALLRCLPVDQDGDDE